MHDNHKRCVVVLYEDDDSDGDSNNDGVDASVGGTHPCGDDEVSPAQQQQPLPPPTMPPAERTLSHMTLTRRKQAHPQQSPKRHQPASCDGAPRADKIALDEPLDDNYISSYLWMLMMQESCEDCANAGAVRDEFADRVIQGIAASTARYAQAQQYVSVPLHPVGQQRAASQLAQDAALGDDEPGSGDDSDEEIALVDDGDSDDSDSSPYTSVDIPEAAGASSRGMSVLMQSGADRYRVANGDSDGPDEDGGD